MLNYFYHPSNMRTQEKILDLRINEHSAGYGVYIMILELLRDSQGYKMAFKPKHISFAINEPSIDMVERIIKNYDLFIIDEDGYVSSPWLTKTMEALESKKQKRKSAAETAAAARWSTENVIKSEKNDVCERNANALQTHNESIADAMPNNTITITNTITNQPTNQTHTRRWMVVDGVDIDVDKIESVCKMKDVDIPDSYTSAAKSLNDDNHNVSMIVDIARFFRLNKIQCSYLIKITNNGLIGGQETKELIALYNKCRSDNFRATFPMNYIISHFSSYQAAKNGK